jgi:hypothetical protein
VKVGSHPLVSQIKDVEIHSYTADPTPHLERIDPLGDEVAEQLRPRRLLLIRAVPDPAPASLVVATGGARGVRAGQQVVPGGALMPEPTGDRSSWGRRDAVGEAHT